MMRLRNGRPGFVLLSVVIAIALILVLYSISWEGMGDSVQVLNPNPTSDMPWKAEWRLEKKHCKEIADEDLRFDRDIYLKMGVSADFGEGGVMRMEVTVDGKVSGRWTGKYETLMPRSNDWVTHQVEEAYFEGIIDPSEMFSKNPVESSDDLYIYAKGRFTIMRTDDSGRYADQRTSGEMFVVGWLDIDNTAYGSMHLTPDRQSQWIYDWKGKESKGY